MAAMDHPLRKFRKARGLTLKEFADAVGTTPSGVHRWETGVNLPTVPMFQKILAATGGRVTPVGMFKAYYVKNSEELLA